MHIEILDQGRAQFLKTLCGLPEFQTFYLAGGTALSLQLGLRKSYDFDFFTHDRFNPETLFAQLKDHFPLIQPLHIGNDTCDVAINDVQVSVLHYPYRLISETVDGGKGFPGLKLAGIDDISVMKLSAIGSRGARKDFYDLFQIYKAVPSFDSRRLFENAHRKFGADFDLTYMLFGLTYFDDAEGEVLPETFVPADWGEIKRFFIAEQAQLIAMERDSFIL